MLRFILSIIFLTLFYIISWPLFLVERVIRIFNPKLAGAFSFCMAKVVVAIILFFCGTRVHVQGKENLIKDKPVLYISNHQGLFDIVVTLFHLPSTTGFVAKQVLLKIPLIHGWGTRIHCLGLDRQDIRQGLKVILQAIENIKAGYSMFIYPEGTRSRTGNMGEFKLGSFKIATKTNVPIIPVAVSGTPQIFEQHFPHVEVRDVYLTFGEPITLDSLSSEDKKQIHVYTQNIIRNLLKEHPQLP